MLKRLCLVLLYGCYGLLLTVVLLVVFFPRDSFLVWLAERVERELPGFKSRIEKVRYIHPFKLGLYQVVIENPMKRITIPIDRLTIGFSKKWPMENFQVSAELYGGRATADVIREDRENLIVLKNLSISSMRLQDVDFLHKMLDRKIQGIYSMSGDMNISARSQVEIEFEGAIEIDDLFIKLRRPVLGVSEIDLTGLSADVQLSHEKAEISGGRFGGELLSGTFSGMIFLQNPWQQSTLDIDGGLLPDDRLLGRDPKLMEDVASLYREYKQEEIPCLIEGTVQEPRFRFGRKTSGESPRR